jgi:type I restriction enzyme S subunit
MELKEGYNLTEVGVIPEDWDVDATKNLASITTGAKNTQDKNDDGMYPFFVRSQKVERINSYSFDGEAVLTAGDGVGTGKVFHYIDGKFDFHQRVYKISNFNEKLDGYFFFLYFSNNFLNRIMQMTAKSSVDSVRMDMIANMPIPLPPSLEQRAIAEALSDVDVLITSLDQLITKKLNLKQGAMQQLLTGDKRLAGFTGNWEEKKIADVAPLQRGFDLPNRELKRGNYPVVYSNGILNRHSTYKAKAPGVITGRSGTIGKVTFIEEDYFPHNTTLWVTDFKGNNPKFIYYLYLFLKLERFSTGSGVPTLNRNDVHANSISIPPTSREQKAIAQILSDMDAEIEKLEQQREKYKAVKQGMMQELLTGKTRLT